MARFGSFKDDGVSTCHIYSYCDCHQCNQCLEQIRHAIHYNDAFFVVVSFNAILFVFYSNSVSHWALFTATVDNNFFNIAFGAPDWSGGNDDDDDNNTLRYCQSQYNQYYDVCSVVVVVLATTTATITANCVEIGAAFRCQWNCHVQSTNVARKLQRSILSQSLVGLARSSDCGRSGTAAQYFCWSGFRRLPPTTISP